MHISGRRKCQDPFNVVSSRYFLMSLHDCGRFKSSITWQYNKTWNSGLDYKNGLKTLQNKYWFKDRRVYGTQLQ